MQTQLQVFLLFFAINVNGTGVAKDNMTIDAGFICNLNATISAQINIACFGGNNGSATVTASGATSPYTYTWNTTPPQYTTTATNLSAGTYSVTVNAANACSKTASVTITQPSAALSATISGQTNVSCFGNSTGSATVTAAGGTSPYTYTWNTSPVQYTTTASNLAAGTYIVTVKDANNCSTTVSVTITQPSAGLNASVSGAGSQVNVSCFGGTNGSATATVTGGTSPYTYTWNTTPAQYTATASNLSAGTYTITVKDANNCSATANVTITQPNAALSATISGQTNVSCFGNSTGSATVAAAGGTSPYTYTWNTTPVSIHNNSHKLAAGTYTVTVKDANNCSTTVSVTITQPSSPISLSNNISYTGNNTNIDLSVSGGTPPYTYSWSNGATTQDLNNVAIGSYTVTVTDSKGCVTTATINTMPELEFCTYNLDIKDNETFNIRDYIHVKSNSAPQTINWSLVYFTYTAAGANDPTIPANWHLTDFNAGNNVTVTATDRAVGTGNHGQGEYRIYLVRNGYPVYDTHMTIRVNTTTSTVVSSLCNPINANSNNVCQGGTISLSASGGTAYSWVGPNAYTNLTSNPTITNAQTNMSGVYTVYVTTPKWKCTSNYYKCNGLWTS